MEALIKLSGGFLVALALLHLGLHRHFGWKEELRPVTLLTRQIHYVHTFFIGLIVLLMGLLCLTCAPDLIQTPLGRILCLGLFIFWLCRLGIQFFGYSPALWKGKSFETAMHVVFSLLWAFLTGVFGLAALGA